MTDEVVTRLHRYLVEELRKRDHPADRPLKVAEIYEDLVPYRAVRSLLRVELNADYEHALLRLLAGEHGLFRLEPEEARLDLRREAAEAFPFVGLYRKFAASDVWVSLSDHDDGPALVPDPTGTTSPPPDGAAPAADVDPIDPPPPVAAAEPVRDDRRSTCGSCDGALPTGRRVRFCPFCGTEQRGRPCHRCDAVLEPGWRYCIGCGHEQPAG